MVVSDCVAALANFCYGVLGQQHRRVSAVDG